MNNRKTVWLGLTAAMAFGLVGCSDSSSEPGTAMVTVVHLAPEVPSVEDTGVDILIDGVTAIEDLTYGESTGRVQLDAGTYEFGVAVGGRTSPVISFDATLADGDDVTVVAYRDPQSVVDVFVFSNSTLGLASGEGRVFVGHGADDSMLDPVNVVVVDGEDCSELIPDFEFGTIAPDGDVLDLTAADYGIGFDITDDCTPEVGPVPVPVTADVVSILVAVDENTADMALDPELWAIIPSTDGDPIRTVKTN